MFGSKSSKFDNIPTSQQTISQPSSSRNRTSSLEPLVEAKRGHNFDNWEKPFLSENLSTRYVGHVEGIPFFRWDLHGCLPNEYIGDSVMTAYLTLLMKTVPPNLSDYNVVPSYQFLSLDHGRAYNPRTLKVNPFKARFTYFLHGEDLHWKGYSMIYYPEEHLVRVSHWDSLIHGHMTHKTKNIFQTLVEQCWASWMGTTAPPNVITTRVNSTHQSDNSSCGLYQIGFIKGCIFTANISQMLASCSFMNFLPPKRADVYFTMRRQLVNNGFTIPNGY